MHKQHESDRYLYTYWNPKLTTKVKEERYNRNESDPVYAARQFQQDRRLAPLDLRYKTEMCAFGSCRIEWIKREDKSSGPRKYCKPHSKIVNDINLKKAQLAYRKRLAPGVIARRNKIYNANQKAYRLELFGE